MAEPTEEDFERVERVANAYETAAPAMSDEARAEFLAHAAALRRVLAAAKGETNE